MTPTEKAQKTPARAGALNGAFALLFVGVALGPDAVAEAMGLAARLSVGFLVAVVVDLVEVLVFVAFRVEFVCMVSMPEWEKAAEEERESANVKWKVDCGEKDAFLVVGCKTWLTGVWEFSLVALPGAWMRLERDSQSYW
jgi:hypothetical protein